MTSDDGMTITETPSATIARQAAEIERLRVENNALASLLECWLNPMLRKDGTWAISSETLEQLMEASKKTLEKRR